MRGADRISGTVWLLFALLVGGESYRLGLGSLNKPGSGFFFFWISIVLAVLSVVVLIGTFTRAKGETKRATSFFGKDNLVKITLVLLSLFLYAFFMETLGFIPVTLLLFLFLMGIIEKKGWHFTLFVSLAVTGVSYLIFVVLLKSQLPQGLLWF